MTSTRIRTRINDREARRAFTAGPEVMTRHISAQLAAGAKLIARTARINAAKHDAFGVNKQSIREEQVDELHFRVVAGSNYARMLEEGTGPAAGRGRYVPNLGSLQQYIKRRAGIRWGRAGSRNRRSQEREVRDRAFGLLLHIVRHGTKAHPIMAPAAEQHRSELHRMVQRGVWLGIAEINGP